MFYRPRCYRAGIRGGFAEIIFSVQILGEQFNIRICATKEKRKGF
jgi:hypothetical protein